MWPVCRPQCMESLFAQRTFIHAHGGCAAAADPWGEPFPLHSPQFLPGAQPQYMIFPGVGVWCGGYSPPTQQNDGGCNTPHLPPHLTPPHPTPYTPAGTRVAHGWHKVGHKVRTRSTSRCEPQGPFPHFHSRYLYVTIAGRLCSPNMCVF